MRQAVEFLAMEDNPRRPTPFCEQAARGPNSALPGVFYETAIHLQPRQVLQTGMAVRADSGYIVAASADPWCNPAPRAVG